MASKFFDIIMEKYLLLNLVQSDTYIDQAEKVIDTITKNAIKVKKAMDIISNQSPMPPESPESTPTGETQMFAHQNEVPTGHPNPGYTQATTSEHPMHTKEQVDAINRDYNNRKFAADDYPLRPNIFAQPGYAETPIITKMTLLNRTSKMIQELFVLQQDIMALK